MKRIVLFVFTLMIVAMVASNAGAFKKGENRINNSTFEADKVGELPAEWDIMSGG